MIHLYNLTSSYRRLLLVLREFSTDVHVLFTGPSYGTFLRKPKHRTGVSYGSFLREFLTGVKRLRTVTIMSPYGTLLREVECFIRDRHTVVRVLNGCFIREHLPYGSLSNTRTGAFLLPYETPVSKHFFGGSKLPYRGPSFRSPYGGTRTATPLTRYGSRMAASDRCDGLIYTFLM